MYIKSTCDVPNIFPHKIKLCGQNKKKDTSKHSHKNGRRIVERKYNHCPIRALEANSWRRRATWRSRFDTRVRIAAFSARSCSHCCSVSAMRARLRCKHGRVDGYAQRLLASPHHAGKLGGQAAAHTSPTHAHTHTLPTSRHFRTAALFRSRFSL